MRIEIEVDDNGFFNCPCGEKDLIIFASVGRTTCTCGLVYIEAVRVVSTKVAVAEGQPNET